MIDYTEPDVFHGPWHAMITQVGSVVKISIPLPRKMNGKLFEIHIYGIGDKWSNELIDLTDERSQEPSVDESKVTE